MVLFLQHNSLASLINSNKIGKLNSGTIIDCGNIDTSADQLINESDIMCGTLGVEATVADLTVEICNKGVEIFLRKDSCVVSVRKVLINDLIVFEVNNSSTSF